MARVEIATQAWGYLVDSTGSPLSGASATLTLLDGSAATTWSAAAGGTSNTTALTSNTNGTLPRFIEEGRYILTSGAASRQVEAIAGRSDTITNIIYASPTGTSSNTGQTSGSPLDLQSALNSLSNYGPVLSGTWRIQLAAGTYNGLFRTPSGLTSKTRLQIWGPTAGHPNVPTAIINAAGVGFGLLIDLKGFAWVRDIKVTNASLTDSSTASGFLGDGAVDVLFDNCHVAGNGAYAGISVTDNSQGKVSGGIISGTQAYGIRIYNSLATIGYNAAALADGPVIQSGSSTSAGILIQHGYADVFYTNITGVPDGVRITSNGRGAVRNSSITNCTTSAVKGQEVSAVEMFGTANTLTGNATDLILLSGSTELTEYTNANAATQNLILDQTQATLTGTVTRTVMKSSVLTVGLWRGGKKVRIRVLGSFTGTAGTKTIEIALLSTSYLAKTTATGATGPFVLEADIYFQGITTQLVRGIYYSGTTAEVLTASKAITLTGAQLFRVYGTLSNVADTITVDAVEVIA